MKVTQLRINGTRESVMMFGSRPACLGDAAQNGAGDWNMQSIREWIDIIK